MVVLAVNEIVVHYIIRRRPKLPHCCLALPSYIESPTPSLNLPLLASNALFTVTRRMAPKRKRKPSSKTPTVEAGGESDEKPTAKRLRRDESEPQVTSPTSLATDGTTVEKHELSTTVDRSSAFVSSKETTTKITIKNLVVNVPKGHQGPLLLKLDVPSLTLDTSPSSKQTLDHVHQSGRLTLRGGVVARGSSTIVTPSYSCSKDKDRCRFLKLPAELRDIVYSEVFVGKQLGGIIPFLDKETDLSSAFLRTCRQIYHEGRKWLYSENKFHINRDWRPVGGYWEPKWSTLGYETPKAFLDTIGTANVSLLRDVTLHFGDFSRSARPHASPDERRYVHDPQLFSILDCLADFGKLQKLKIIFDGISSQVPLTLTDLLMNFKGGECYMEEQTSDHSSVGL